MNHAIRVTLPFVDCSGIVAKWADRCVAAVVYQHDADEEVSKTHIHLGLYKCDVRAEALKRLWVDAPGKGNEFWSWKEWEVEKSDTGFVKTNKYLTYMTKGKLRPVFVKNISNDLLEESRQAWVDPVATAQSARDSTQYYIDEMLNVYKSFVDLSYLEHYYTREKFEYSNTITASYGDYCEFLLLDVRKKTMKFMFRENRRTPPATLYKTVCGTVFLTIADRCGVLDKAIEVLANKWY